MQRQHLSQPQQKQQCDQQFQLFEPMDSITMKSASQQHKNKDSQRALHASQSAASQLQQQQWDSAMGTERLTSLHAKLHQEADKIRKWKVQTEMEMKHKEKKLSEANQTIESLRKSILELQLENENLSTKLQDELSCREETLKRVQNTRELIAFLKNQEEKLEQKLSCCETERTELKYLEKEHAKQFEEMVCKFRQLQMDAKESRERLLSQVYEDQEKLKRLEAEWKEKTETANTQIKSLTSKIDETEVALREVHMMLQKTEEKLHASDKELGAAQQKVESLSDTLTARVEELEKFKTECAILQTEKEQLATELVEERDRAETAKRQEDSVQEALNNSVAIFNQRQHDLQKDIERLKAELAEEQTRLKESRSRLTESLMFSESLKSSRDVLLLEKTEMELCLEKLKDELTGLQADKYKNKEEISGLENEVESLTLQLDHEQRKVTRLQGQVDEMSPRYGGLEKERRQMQQELQDLRQAVETSRQELERAVQAEADGRAENQQLQQTVAQLQAQLGEKACELEGLQRIVEDMQQQLISKEADISSTAAQLQTLSADLQALNIEHCNSKTYICKLEGDLNALSETKQAMEFKLNELEEEKKHLLEEKEQKGQAAEEEHQTSAQLQQQLEHKLKEVNADVKSKNKAIKDLEKELKTLRSKVTTLERKQEEKSREVDYLKQELTSSEQTKEQADKLIASLQSHLEQETVKTNDLTQKVARSTAEGAQAQKEKAEALVQCERQIIEMSATLEKYTSDHQKLLTQKDKEIEELRSKVVQLTAANQQYNQSINDGKSEVIQLSEQITTLKIHLEELQTEKEASTEELKKQLEEQIKLVDLMSKRSAASESQTSREHAVEKEKPVVQSAQLTPATPVAQAVSSLQRSILRQCTVSGKRRKVAFISPSVEERGTFEDSESSVDLELEEHLLSQKVAGPRTPLRLRPSPRGSRQPTLIFTPSRSKLATVVAAVTPAPASPLPQKFREQGYRHQKAPKTPNMRKAPMRTSKFFRSSPKERKTLKQKNEARDRLPWFDDDAVYGFSSED